MIERFLFDASAVLAILHEENITIDLHKYLENSVINCVNACEVLTVLQNHNMPKEIAKRVLESTIVEVIPVSLEEGYLAAEIKTQNRKYGISTGDSFCLASGILLKHTIITADKIREKLDLNCPIILIR